MSQSDGQLANLLRTQLESNLKSIEGLLGRLLRLASADDEEGYEDQFSDEQDDEAQEPPVGRSLGRAEPVRSSRHRSSVN